MAIELVTGHSGAPHVSGADVGAMNALTLGGEAYVLGHAPSVTMTDANTLSISPCELLVCGRHIRLTGTNTVSVESGAQAGMRHDLVYVRYARDADTGVETASLGVRRGETAESATDPPLENVASILDGASVADIAIARVSLDALTPTASWLLPSWRLPVSSGGTGAASAAAARTSLGAAAESHTHSAADVTAGTLAAARGGTGQTSLQATRNAMGLGNTTGALPVANGGTGQTAPARLYAANGWYVYVVGSMVWVYVHDIKTGSGSWDSTTCPYVMPSSYRPSSYVIVPLCTPNGDSTTGQLSVTNVGKIVVMNAGANGTTEARQGLLCYPIGF